MALMIVTEAEEEIDQGIEVDSLKDEIIMDGTDEIDLETIDNKDKVDMDIIMVMVAEVAMEEEMGTEAVEEEAEEDMVVVVVEAVDIMELQRTNTKYPVFMNNY